MGIIAIRSLGTTTQQRFDDFAPRRQFDDNTTSCRPASFFSISSDYLQSLQKSPILFTASSYHTANFFFASCHPISRQHHQPTTLIPHSRASLRHIERGQAYHLLNTSEHKTDSRNGDTGFLHMASSSVCYVAIVSRRRLDSRRRRATRQSNSPRSNTCGIPKILDPTSERSKGVTPDEGIPRSRA